MCPAKCIFINISMAIVVKKLTSSFIDHCEFINGIYKSVELTEIETTNYEINPTLFCIKNDKQYCNKKRKLDDRQLQEEIIKVKSLYETFLIEIPINIRSDINKRYNLATKGEVRDLSKKLFELTIYEHSGLNGGNNSKKPLRCKIRNEDFIIPARSRFFCGSVKEQCLKLDGSKFDVLIADPPWWNKFIRRLKSANDKLSYKMMYNEEIASLPVKKLLSDNSLVAVWCTNSPSNISAVKDLIFPAWDVEYITTWYWIKVTIDLEPLCPFSSGCKKQPYERLVLGKVGELKQELKEQMFMSVPSALHSHKPPLLDLLTPYVKAEDPQVLELFARYLLPNTTSVGFEPLKWQHTSLYENVS